MVLQRWLIHNFQAYSFNEALLYVILARPWIHVQQFLQLPNQYFQSQLPLHKVLNFLSIDIWIQFNLQYSWIIHRWTTKTILLNYRPLAQIDSKRFLDSKNKQIIPLIWAVRKGIAPKRLKFQLFSKFNETWQESKFEKEQDAKKNRCKSTILPKWSIFNQISEICTNMRLNIDMSSG